MFILDTNVLSEIIRERPDPAVPAWINPIRRSDLFVAAPTKAEMYYGVARKPEGRKRADLKVAVDVLFNEAFRNRVLSFDSESAWHFAFMAAQMRADGRDIGYMDLQIAAIARRWQFSVVTRNVKHFQGFGLDVINPWTAA